MTGSNFRPLIIALIALVLTAPAAASGQIYRWVDDNGTVHFSHIVPDGVNAVPVGVRPNTVDTVSSAPRSQANPPATAETPEGSEASEMTPAEQRRARWAEQRQEQAEERARRQRECALMRRQKEFLEPSPRVMIEDDEGNVTRLPDEERLAGLREANAFLAEHCSD
ncbi:MAG: DUF4124 domain-containing protein [Xanthomonadales bacterium]|nr:DUF4124 domain-containing protein [Xanthomonadales bacterium]